MAIITLYIRCNSSTLDHRLFNMISKEAIKVKNFVKNSTICSVTIQRLKLNTFWLRRITKRNFSLK